jgi:xanthine phosphoribosyltransferase
VKPRPFEEITARIAKWPFPAGLDGVVGIATGGVVPAALVAQRLGLGLKVVAVSYRSRETNAPQFAQPQLVADVPGLGAWKRVLLVDDVYLSGKSWAAARAVLPPKMEVLPFVLSGEVDFALYREAKVRFEWPWTIG